MWQLGTIKIASAAVGVLIGAYWAPFWSHYYPLLWLIVVVFGAWAGTIWIRALRKPS